MAKSIMRSKSYDFAICTVNLYKELQEKREFIMGKQLLRSGTSVGANIRESANAQSKADFIHKLSISQKECDESIYWLELLKDTGYIDSTTFQTMEKQADELLRMIKSSIITVKNNMNKK